MADTIWNNNYLLSNLDAQKLYAQSPLTTGVSGTSAYIGIEPSARYNETVLWSGSLSYGNSATLSESVQNFEKIRFKWSDWVSTQTIHLNEFAHQNNSTSYYSMVGSWHGNASATITLFKLGCHDNGSNVISFDHGTFAPTTATAYYPATESRILEIIGVNRKENV